MLQNLSLNSSSGSFCLMKLNFLPSLDLRTQVALSRFHLLLAVSFKNILFNEEKRDRIVFSFFNSTILEMMHV